MPGFITHFLAGRYVFNKQPNKNLIKENIFNMGTLGPDIYFYYPFSKGLASLMHNNNLGLFLLNMAKMCKKNMVLYSYTAGFLVHYCLDMYIHPFIHGFTYQEGDAYLNNISRHCVLETTIDTKILKRLTGLTPSDLSLWSLIKIDKYNRKIISQAVNETINHIYNKKIKITDIAMRYFMLGIMLFQSDTGTTKLLFEKLESFFVKIPLFSAMVHSQEVDDKDYFNMKKENWSPPWDRENIRNESFMELLKKAIDESIKMNNALLMYVQGNIPISELKKIIGNNSLKTGLDSNINAW